MPYERAEVEVLQRRLAETPRTIQAIFGPRQSGKTTIVKQALRRVEQVPLYRAVDDPGVDQPGGPTTAHPGAPLPGVRDRSWLVQTWEEARHQAERHGGGVLVLDEIQKIDQWSTTVKGLWDADRFRDLPLHVVILGSAPMLMQSGLTESLAGRFELIPVRHWSFQEMADAFRLNLHQYLYFGGYPGAADLSTEPPKWRNYVRSALIETTIEKDVVDMTRVEKPALLKRLFELGAACSGQILSLEKIQGQLRDRGNIATLADYLQLLSRVGLLAGVPGFSRSPSRKHMVPPKLIVLNTALMTALSDYSFAEAQADRTFWGRIVESAVGAHIHNTADTRMKVHHWRDANDDEVDFVMTRGPRIVAVEVKSGAKTRPTRGMRVFENRFQPHRSLLVTEAEGGPGSVPLAEFLSRPASDWFEEVE